MSLTPEQVKTAITIGKYGGCLPACSGSIITGSFNLAGCKVIVVPARVQEGGSHPLLPGEIQHLYQPVQEQPGWWTRQDDPVPKQLVQVKITFNDKEYDKYLMLSERRKNAVISIVNFIDSTDQRIRVAASKLKKQTTRAIVSIKNFALRWRK